MRNFSATDKSTASANGSFASPATSTVPAFTKGANFECVLRAFCEVRLLG